MNLFGVSPTRFQGGGSRPRGRDPPVGGTGAPKLGRKKRVRHRKKTNKTNKQNTSAEWERIQWKLEQNEKKNTQRNNGGREIGALPFGRHFVVVVVVVVVFFSFWPLVRLSCRRVDNNDAINCAFHFCFIIFFFLFGHRRLRRRTWRDLISAPHSCCTRGASSWTCVSSSSWYSSGWLFGCCVFLFFFFCQQNETHLRP